MDEFWGEDLPYEGQKVDDVAERLVRGGALEIRARHAQWVEYRGPQVVSEGHTARGLEMRGEDLDPGVRVNPPAGYGRDRLRSVEPVTRGVRE